MAGSWTKQQTVTANNGATAGTSLTISPAATQVNSTLIIAMSSAAAATFTAPAGWVRIAMFGITGAGALGLFKYENNPGGINSVQITSSVSTLLSAVLSEYVVTGVPASTQQQEGITETFNNANGTAVSGFVPILVTNDLVVCAVGYVGTVALTCTINSAGFTQDGATFGTAATSAGVLLFSNLNPGTAGNINFSGTLSGTPTNGPGVALAAFTLTAIYSNNGQVGPIAETIGGVYQP